MRLAVHCVHCGALQEMSSVEFGERSVRVVAYCHGRRVSLEIARSAFDAGSDINAAVSPHGADRCPYRRIPEWERFTQAALLPFVEDVR